MKEFEKKGYFVESDGSHSNASGSAAMSSKKKKADVEDKGRASTAGSKRGSKM